VPDAAGSLRAAKTGLDLFPVAGLPAHQRERFRALDDLEREIDVDLAGFEREMTAQRLRAKAARKGITTDADRLDAYREVVEQFGVTEFVGYASDASDGRVLAVVPVDDSDQIEIFLDRTPFYAESGGQVGDTGVLETANGARVRIDDTQYGLPGLVVHRGVVEAGTVRWPACASHDQGP